MKARTRRSWSAVQVSAPWHANRAGRGKRTDGGADDWREAEGGRRQPTGGAAAHMGCGLGEDDHIPRHGAHLHHSVLVLLHARQPPRQRQVGFMRPLHTNRKPPRRFVKKLRVWRPEASLARSGLGQSGGWRTGTMASPPVPTGSSARKNSHTTRPENILPAVRNRQPKAVVKARGSAVRRVCVGQLTLEHVLLGEVGPLETAAVQRLPANIGALSGNPQGRRQA